MKRELHFVLALLISSASSFPADPSPSDETLNDVDHGSAMDFKPPAENVREIEMEKTWDFINSTTQKTVNLTLKPQWLAPLIQKFQFSPQSFFLDRLFQLKDGLKSLGVPLPEQNVTAKQLSNSILHLVGVTDPDFYTNRLDPAGFFQGNGWFANKGGLLGGPGAIFSTGSLLTDYPTAYRKK